MVWQICIRYPNGQERVLRSCKNREIALKYVDAIYAKGYPMHVAYIVRQVETHNPFLSNSGYEPLRRIWYSP